MSSKPLVGTTSIPKPQPGRTIVERASFVSARSDADTVSAFTTAAGLGNWLGTVTKFDSRRGGTVRFESGFAGTYSLMQVPNHVVLVTERHGEIEIKLQPKTTPVQVDVTITRFVFDTEDLESVRGILLQTLQSLREYLHG